EAYKISLPVYCRAILILLEDGSHNVDYQGKQYCFLLAAVDNDRTNKGETDETHGRIDPFQT
ncbi:hypothetical protein, partial [Enterobacter hormaechei]